MIKCGAGALARERPRIDKALLGKRHLFSGSLVILGNGRWNLLQCIQTRVQAGLVTRRSVLMKHALLYGFVQT